MFRLNNQHPQNVRTRLAEIMGVLEGFNKNGNAVVSVSDTKVRVRQLQGGF